MNKTVNLYGGEIAVKLAGRHCSIRNDGSSTLYASAKSGITADADGVISVPAGQAAVLLDSEGNVFLYGTGKAQLISSDYPGNFFKPAAGGSISGGAGTAYTIKWTSANPGTDILAMAESAADGQRTYVRIYGSPTCPTNYGYDPANNDFWYTIDKLDNDWISITAKDMRTNAEFVNTKSVDGWAGWVKCSDGGNANSLSGRTASEFLRYTAGVDGDADTIVSSGIYKGTFANVPEGLPDGQGTLIVLNYLSANEEISGSIGTDTLWLRQWFVCAHGYYVYERSAAGIGVSEWKPVNNNGNAAMIAGKTSSEIVSDISFFDGSLTITFADGSQKTVSISQSS